ncbi:DUF3857 domain-containing protein [Hymenobacter sp. B81]|uniref:DUF3857 domain-containing protein n=1 Tax=Hymenobacter sp. B81 TaxID=3344878 RepID=UPI0037DDAA2D
MTPAIPRRALLTWLLGALPLLPLLAQKQPAPAPSLVYADYKWQDRRARLPLKAAEEAQPAVVLRDFTAHEYAFDPQSRQPVVYSVEHRIVRVNSDEGIERYNKIYLPLSEAGRVVQLRARTISARGQVVEVDQSSMKELRDGEGGNRSYKIFALEGVEKGSEIEYVYARIRDMEYFGRERLQSEIPAHDVSLELISPRNITLEARTYGGPAVTTDTTAEGKNRLHLRLADVAALRDEEFAHPKARQMRVEYKVAYAGEGKRLFTWADAGQFVYERVWQPLKTDAKAVQKLDKQFNVPTSLPQEEQIRALELALKTQINVDPGAGADLAQIATTRTASDLGMVRLMAALLKARKIPHEVVVVADRSEAPLDADFDSWNFLDHFVLYFPATKQFAAPSRPDYRYGVIPPEWTAAKGLFVRLVQLGQAESAVGTVREVPTLSADQSPYDMTVGVQFAPALDKVTVNLQQVLGGYQAEPLQAIYPQIPADKRTEAMQGMVKGVLADAVFKSLKVTNAEPASNPLLHPFTIDATVESAAVLDRAGPRYLFKIGELIGSQSQLYQEQERQLDVENDYNRRYNRTITFDIPAGYVVRNLADLNINAETGPAGSPAFWFRSSFQQQGQQVTVRILESYTQIHWPKQDFEAFRKVVNAAANFNKVVLVLEKKS